MKRQMKQAKRFAGEYIVPILAAFGAGGLVGDAIRSMQPPADRDSGSWEGENPQDRTMINSLHKGLMDGTLSGRQVNTLIKSGRLSDRVIFLLGDIHDPGAHIEPGEDTSQLNAVWTRAYRNNGVEL